MSSLFADTHNVVAILEKSVAAEGFEQIIDFLSGSYIHYALIVNPHIYISCIKQFWNTASVKRSDDVTRLQALVDKKKIMISEVVIREILQLDDVEGVVCLPNEEIFVGLAQMGYEKPSTKLTFYKAFFSSQWKFLIRTILQSLSAKRTSWNEFSTAMASTVICLSKGQKLNFSKRVENLENDKATQKLEIIKLKARVKRLEMANKGRMIDDLDKDEGIELVKDTDIAKTKGRHAAAEQVEKQAEIYRLDLDHPSKVLRLGKGDDVQEPVAEEVVADVVPPTSTLPSPPSPVIPSSPPHQPPCPPYPQDAEGSSLLF
nr:hypothetical protein [Tanacetum cinerariifolium]